MSSLVSPLTDIINARFPCYAGGGQLVPLHKGAFCGGDLEDGGEK